MSRTDPEAALEDFSSVCPCVCFSSGLSASVTCTCSVGVCCVVTVVRKHVTEIKFFFKWAPTPFMRSEVVICLDLFRPLLTCSRSPDEGSLDKCPADSRSHVTVALCCHWRNGEVSGTPGPPLSNGAADFRSPFAPPVFVWLERVTQQIF